MTLTLFTGTANPALAGAVAAVLGAPLGQCDVRCFPDGELHVGLGGSVRGHTGDVQNRAPIIVDDSASRSRICSRCGSRWRR